MIAVAGASYVSGRTAGSSVRMIAFPATVQESSVLAALALFGIDNAVGASSALVPLSNFSRIIAVTFQNASERVLPGDPRRTPFLDELRRRFTVPGPDEAPWTVIYIPGVTRTRDQATARVLAGLTPDWAWDGTGPAGGSRWLLLPPLLWAAWLIVRNTRRDRIWRLLWVISFLPLLLGARPGGSLLFMVLTAACTLATRHSLSGSGQRLLFILWPYAVAAIALLIYEPDSLPYGAVSAVLAGITGWLGQRLERCTSQRRLHAPPAFRIITLSGVHEYARRINRVLAVPVAALLIMHALVPARAGSDVADAPRFRIERASAQERQAAGSLFEEHLAFQHAITYGRLGDFSLENTAYIPAYRYKEEKGRMVRSGDSEDSPGAWPSTAFKAAIKVLSGEGPGSIQPK